MTKKIIKRLTGKERTRLWNKLENVISYGTMLCFLFLYLMIIGLGILQTNPVSSTYIKGQILLESGLQNGRVAAFLEDAEDLIYLESENTVLLDRSGERGRLRMDEVLKLENDSLLILVDNSGLIRKVHRQSLCLPLSSL